MMKLNKEFLLSALFLFLSFNVIVAQELITYSDIPGRNASDQYTCRVRQAGGEWQNAFVLQTECKYNPKSDGGTHNGYFEKLEGWTASWIAFEFSETEVEVEISKINGEITKAMVRPVADASEALIVDGKAYITFSEAANVNVDINGQMEDTYTGMGYSGAPVHTISIFANPVFTPPSGPKVVTLQPDDNINSLNRDDWDAIIFAPGVHNIGLGFQILDDEILYIPGDAVVHGTIHPLDAFGDAASQNFSVYGSGTLSGEEIFWRTGDKDSKPFTYQAEGAHLEGFVVADPAHHTFNMNCSTNDPSNINVYKNLKILAWRVNSDGINAFRHSEISDCFFRCQDDAFYLGTNVNIHDNVVWNDANGAVLYLPRAGDASSSVFKDITVIYHRASWHWWDGGRIISMRTITPGTTISNVHIQNVLIEDPLPAFPPFYGTMEAGTGDINLNNIIFENIRQLHDGVASAQDAQNGKPRNTLTGLDADRQWENITFKNCYFDGKWLNSFEDGNFLTNDYVDRNTVKFVIDTAVTNVTGVSISGCPALDLEAGTVHQLTASVLPSNATDKSVSWSSSNPSVATVDANGLVTAVAPGSAIITVTTNDGTHTSTCNIDVTAINAIINFVAPDQVKQGGTFNTTVYYSAIDSLGMRVFIQLNSAPWTEYGSTTISIAKGIDNVDVDVTVDPDIPVADGAYKIVATIMPLGGGWPDRYDDVKKTGVDALDSTFIFVADVTMENCPDTDLLEGINHQLTANVMPADANNSTVIWSSSNNALATVDANGLVNTISAGDVTITATTEDGGFSASCNLEVAPIVVSDVLMTGCPDVEMITTETLQLSAEVIPSEASNKSVSWKSSDETIATVDQNGVVTAISEGTVNIEVSTTDGGFTDICEVNVAKATTIKPVHRSVNGTVNIYPNPVSNMLNIDNIEGSQVNLFNMSGQLVFTQIATESDMTIDMKKLKLNGIVIVQIITGQEVYIHEVAVK